MFGLLSFILLCDFEESIVDFYRLALVVQHKNRTKIKKSRAFLYK